MAAIRRLARRGHVVPAANRASAGAAADVSFGKRWFAGTFQRDEERRALSLRNLTSFRDILAMSSNGRLVENRRASQKRVD